MTFTRPELLVLAPSAAVLLTGGLAWYWQRARRLVDAYGGPGPARRLTGRRLELFPFARLVCLLAATAALTIAAADPQPDEGMPPPPTTPIDLIVAVDVSHSMTGADVDSSRISLARKAVGQIVDRGVADRVSLTLFADWPLGLVPLTDDPAVITFFSPWIDTELMASRDQGTSLAAVVGDALQTWEARSRDATLPLLLILTDGEDQGTPGAIMDSIAAASEVGIVVWTGGLGSDDGAALFAPGTDDVPMLDGSGRPVVSTPDLDLLRSMAQTGGGEFHEISTAGDVDRLVDALGDLGGPVTADAPATRSPVGLLLLIALALLVTDSVLDSGRLRRRRRA